MTMVRTTTSTMPTTANLKTTTTNSDYFGFCDYKFGFDNYDDFYSICDFYDGTETATTSTTFTTYMGTVKEEMLVIMFCFVTRRELYHSDLLFRKCERITTVYSFRKLYTFLY
jgi:hypothetical protein